ncbi:hypothetical protein [Mycoplasmopsis edwardii]|uniref:Uncharacterized protein n=3 Tax=Mycoplasmopsis edwardii TaxID=53558 RepID=A0ACD4PH67_9BACT|nr:hypothetical protein [Mycoplasmopsis edwardii]WBP84009.1 hypothetical protein Me_995_000642 [Mycoplasmopsis edwardii]
MQKNKSVDALVHFDALAHSHNFVYSLYSNTLENIKKRGTASSPFEVVINLEALIKLVYLEKNVVVQERSFAAENQLPFIKFNEDKIYLNVLIKSTWRKFNKWKRRNLSSNSERTIFATMNKLYSTDPDLLILLYFDHKSLSLRIKKVTNLNPNYYSVIEVNDKKFPYIDFE